MQTGDIPTHLILEMVPSRDDSNRALALTSRLPPRPLNKEVLRV